MAILAGLIGLVWRFAGNAVGEAFPAPRPVPGRSTVGGGDPSLDAGPVSIGVAVGGLVLRALDALLLAAAAAGRAPLTEPRAPTGARRL